MSRATIQLARDLQLCRISGHEQQSRSSTWGVSAHFCRKGARQTAVAARVELAYGQGMRVPSTFPVFMRDKFTLHMNIYRLILGAVVLAVVIPFWASGHQPMWPVALLALLAVAAAGVLLAREPRLRKWLHR